MILAEPSSTCQLTSFSMCKLFIMYELQGTLSKNACMAAGTCVLKRERISLNLLMSKYTEFEFNLNGSTIVNPLKRTSMLTCNCMVQTCVKEKEDSLEGLSGDRIDRLIILCKNTEFEFYFCASFHYVQASR